MAITIETYLLEQKKTIDLLLPATIDKLNVPRKLKDSMNYSLEAGGKRIRPILLIASLKAFQKDIGLGIKTACALEMIHTYSLIHDDLPSMDNDDLRRGRPTNHKVFGEATAILAGDALLTYSFELIAEDATLPIEKRLKLIKRLAQAAGPEGMVAGQTSDMESESKAITVQELEYIHTNKTGKLLAYAVWAGAFIAGAKQEQLEHLEQYAYHLGLAFQIRDDILDIEGDEEVIGKPVGSDSGNYKNTYPSLLGMSDAKKKLDDHFSLAKVALEKANVESDLLNGIASFIISRNH